MSTNEAMRELWNGEDASAWVEHPDRYDRMLGCFNEPVLEAAALRSGDRVLDVGCGAGDLAGPLRSPWARTARSSASTSPRSCWQSPAGGLEGAPGASVRLVEGDAQQDEVPARPYDAVISRFGVMFFDNPWILQPVLAAAEHVGMPPVPEPGAPGPFAFGEEETFGRMLLRNAAPEAREAAVQALREVLSGHERDGQVRMQCAVWLVTARNG